MKNWEDTIPDIIADFERRIAGGITPADRLTRDRVFDMLSYHAWGKHFVTWDNVNAWFEANRPEIPGRKDTSRAVSPIRQLDFTVPQTCCFCGRAGNTRLYWLPTPYVAPLTGIEVAWCEECSFQVIGYLASSWGQEMIVKQDKRGEKQA